MPEIVNLTVADIISGIWGFLNTNFSAALFGALAGAYAAHRIALRKERTDRLVGAIEATNTAIGLTNSIANVYISIKRQLLMNLAATYREQFEQFANQIQQAEGVIGQAPNIVTVLADFRNISVPTVPIAALRDVVAAKIGPSVHAGSLTQSLSQSIESFDRSIKVRNQSIIALHQCGDEERVLRYFGLRVPGGIDETYPDVMHGLTLQIDDCIYFSMKLAEILVQHGRNLPELLKRAGKNPNVVTVSYENVPQAVLPNPDDYPDFERQYPTPLKSTKIKQSVWRKLFDAAQ